MRTGFLLLTAAALLATGPGCGGDRPPLASVTGRVTFKNEPLTAGSVTFHPDAGNAYQKDKPSSLLQVDGSFTMQTFPFGPGVPPGKYKVTLTPDLANRIKKPNYADPAKTPWAVDVPDGGLSSHVFEVK